MAAKDPNKKRKQSAQEKVRRQQAAKRRTRDVKGEFAAGAASGGAGDHVKGYGAKRTRYRYTAGSTQEEVDARYADLHHKIGAGKLSDADIRDLAHDVTQGRTGEEEQPYPSQRPIRTTSTDIKNIDRLRRQGKWRTDKGLYTQESAQKGRYVSPNAFITKELAPEHKQWVDKALQDPKSEFNAGLDPRAARHGGKTSPAARNRIKVYTQALQEGKSHPEALELLRQERRGRPGGAVTKRVTGREARYNRPAGRRSKTQPVAPGAREFSFGVSAAAPDSQQVLQQKFPDANAQDLVRLQQYQRQSVADELLKNQRWTHETQRANLLGNAGKEKTSDRVVFFTTSVGYPALSVPSDSLIGQYVVGQRKKFLRQEGIARGKDLQGKFPEAVRDMHVIEAATGVAFGAEGRWGAFQKSGWRKGSKKSRGFGKPAPFGQQVLYDSQGRPMYDSQGNIRYTEGGTRPFSVGVDKDLGLRIFVG